MEPDMPPHPQPLVPARGPAPRTSLPRIPRRTRQIVAAGVILALVAYAVLSSVTGSRELRQSVQRSQLATRGMLNAYYESGAGLLSRYPVTSGQAYKAPWLLELSSVEPADLWGYSWALGAVEDAAQLPGGSRDMTVVRSLADNLSLYWDASAPVPAYAPTMAPGPDAIKYFDDNAWAALDLVEAYRLTHERFYLQRAQDVFRYEESGWDATAGGIYWSDRRITRNAASNGPAGELAAYLYIETHDASYLRWAKRIYAWEVQHLVDRSTGEVYEKVDAAGNVGKRMWTYDQGTLVGTAVLLYKITGKRPYLTQANKTASYVLHDAVQPGGALVPQAEFNGVLADNLQLLYQVTHATAIRHLIRTNARLAWTEARNAQDLFAEDWEGPPPRTVRDPLLFQTGAVRLLAVNAALAMGGFPDLAL